MQVEGTSNTKVLKKSGMWPVWEIEAIGAGVEAANGRLVKMRPEVAQDRS